MIVALITPEYTHYIQLQSNSDKHNNSMLLSQDSGCHGPKKIVREKEGASRSR